MSERAKTHGGPAYPIESYLTNGIMQAEGKTLRDEFAGLALVGLYACRDLQLATLHDMAETGSGEFEECMAKQAYKQADAMLAHKFATDPEPYDVSTEWGE